MTDPIREDERTYTPTPHNVTRARTRTAQLTIDWGHPTLAGDVALVTSELTTNAILHGSLRDRLIHIRLCTTDTTLRLEVSDPRAERVPSPRAAIPTEQFGRGLTLVNALCHDWGHGPRDGIGKTVWAEWKLPN
ncbi:ATP-binding protein [Streptomyces acidiscabies]|uniref:Regulatory protein n=1 Tax=Streptomyces acidiscabies TaxID=42234 RepID=A0A0L0KFC5_9ACTN|nr:ATP-binding protein [Streptomyces acidiscabies]KND36538.1 regulatory protein [Streptomyces acidiscabies]